MPVMRWAMLFLALLLPVPASAESGPAPPRPVRLQLKWLHQFQSAGFYAAVQQGYFRDAGLEVELLEGRPDLDPVEVVLAGEAEFGVGNSGLVVHRAEGKPVVAMAVILQHSPFVLLARTGDDLRSVHDLSNKVLMLEEHAHELLAYLNYERVPLDSLTIVPYAGDWSWLGTRVDALTAYTTTEPFDLKRTGTPYQVFNPRASGIDFYGDTLFTTEGMIETDPALVRALRDAVLRGWRYAMDHPDAMIDLIREVYAPNLSRERLQFEAREMRRLMIADMVEMGYMYEGRWRHIADGFAAAGLMPRAFPLDGFLFEPDAKPDLRWLYLSLAVAITISLVVSAVLAYVHRLNLSLQAENAARQRLEGELRSLAATDPLTGIANRRHWFEHTEQEVMRARRFAQPLAVLLLDLDEFKHINDSHGHAAGDRVLIAFSRCCLDSLRGVDFFGRIGGEEFAVALPGTGQQGAMEAAERIRRNAEALAIEVGGGVLRVSTSIGVALLRPDDADVDALLARADAALYAAKRSGRNRVCLEDCAASRAAGEQD